MSPRYASAATSSTSTWPDRDQSWRGWLFRVAQREAWRLNALEWKERDHVDLNGELVAQPDPRDRYDERIRFDAALQELKKLPPALQRVVLIRSQVWKRRSPRSWGSGLTRSRTVARGRAALAIDDYRTANCHNLPVDAIGLVPAEPAARRSYVRVQRAIGELRNERERRHGGIER